MALTENIVEEAALNWCGELGYAVSDGTHLAPDQNAAARTSFGDVVLVGPLCDAIAGALFLR